MEKFYILSYFKTRFPRKISYYEIMQPKVWAPPDTCKVCGQVVSQDLWLPPQRVRFSSADTSCWQDVMWGVPGLFLVSERFRKIYEGEGLTGFNPFDPPVVIEKLGKYKRGVFPVTLPTYYSVTIPWGRGEIDQEKSEFVYEKDDNEVYCPLGRHNGYLSSYQRYVMKEGTWQGDDFFTPISPTLTNLGSERLKEVLHKYQVTGLNLIPSENMKFNLHSFDMWTVRE
jgi:hypothetical protein